MSDNLWHAEVVLAQANHASQKKNCYTWKSRGITFQLTHVCDIIFSFLLVALCLLASISDPFLRLHHQGIDIVVTLHAIPPTISWWWSEKPEDWIPLKSMVFDGSCNFLFNWMCELHLPSYHPTEFQKKLQSLPVFQKDRLEIVHHLCTLWNIWRHWLTTPLGMWDITCSHHTWQHIAHAWQWRYWHMLLRKDPCQYYSPPAALALQHESHQDHHEESPCHDL